MRCFSLLCSQKSPEGRYQPVIIIFRSAISFPFKDLCPVDKRVSLASNGPRGASNVEDRRTWPYVTNLLVDVDLCGLHRKHLEEGYICI